jgi:hypothetical protein
MRLPSNIQQDVTLRHLDVTPQHLTPAGPHFPCLPLRLTEPLGPSTAGPDTAHMLNPKPRAAQPHGIDDESERSQDLGWARGLRS